MEKALFTLILMGSIMLGCPHAPVRPSPGDDPNPGDRSGNGECERDRDCKKICGDIFKVRADKQVCLEDLPIQQVELLEKVYDVLSEPSERDLKEMDLDSLQVLLSISIKPVETAADRMSQTETKKTLAWLGENNKAAEIIQKKDKDFNILKNLLKNINLDAETALSAPIDRGDNFIEIAADKKNKVALAWVHEYFEEICSDDPDYTKCVFKDHYCVLKLNGEAEEYYLGYELFDKILEDVLQEARPSSPPSWWDERVDIDEIDTWLGDNDVCGQAEFS